MAQMVGYPNAYAPPPRASGSPSGYPQATVRTAAAPGVVTAPPHPGTPIQRVNPATVSYPLDSTGSAEKIQHALASAQGIIATSRAGPDSTPTTSIRTQSEQPPTQSLPARPWPANRGQVPTVNVALQRQRGAQAVAVSARPPTGSGSAPMARIGSQDLPDARVATLESQGQPQGQPQLDDTLGSFMAKVMEKLESLEENMSEMKRKMETPAQGTVVAAPSAKAARGYPGPPTELLKVPSAAPSDHIMSPSMGSSAVPLSVIHSDMEAVKDRVRLLACAWDPDEPLPGSGEKTLGRGVSDTLIKALDILCDVAQGGMLLVLAPDAELKRLSDKHCTDADQGYMAHRLGTHNLFHPELAHAFREFTEHSDTDRWPDDYPDEKARDLKEPINVSDITHFRIIDNQLQVFNGESWFFLLKEQVSLSQVQWHRFMNKLVYMQEGEEADFGIVDAARLREGQAARFTDAIKSELGKDVRTLLRSRGKPKDGAFLFNPEGLPIRCATKLTGLPRCSQVWHGVGTRHETALMTVWFLATSCVLIRSDSGALHILLRWPQGVPEVHSIPKEAKNDNLPGSFMDSQGPAGLRKLSHKLTAHLLDNRHNLSDNYNMSEAKKISKDNNTSAIACTVWIAKNTHTDRKHAIKAIPRTHIDKTELNQEIQIMKTVDHPNIVKLMSTFEDKDNFYLVMQLCEGGSLIERMGELRNERYTAGIMRSTLRGVCHLHRHNICHRDIQPENLLLREQAPIGQCNLKICSFRLATTFSPGKAMMLQVGSPLYMAPEIRACRYTQAVDLWNCGVITYLCLSGEHPFTPGDEDPEPRVDLEKDIFQGVSMDAKSFVRELLEPNPKARCTAEQALSKAWLMAPRQEKAAFNDDIMENLAKFHKKNYLQKVAAHILSRSLEDDEIEGFQQIFEELDKNGDGVVTYAELQHAVQQYAGDPSKDSEKSQQLIRLVQEIQSNSQDSIDYNGFLAAVTASRRHYKRESLQNAFKFFDNDKDGKITYRELQHVLEMQGVKVALRDDIIVELIKEADSNQDGTIDFDEFLALMDLKELKGGLQSQQLGPLTVPASSGHGDDDEPGA